jgi:hypothetical protein
MAFVSMFQPEQLNRKKDPQLSPKEFQSFWFPLVNQLHIANEENLIPIYRPNQDCRVSGYSRLKNLRPTMRESRAPSPLSAGERFIESPAIAMNCHTYQVHNMNQQSEPSRFQPETRQIPTQSSEFTSGYLSFSQFRP